MAVKLTLPTFPGQPKIIHSQTTGSIGLDGGLNVKPRGSADKSANQPKRVYFRRPEDIRPRGSSEKGSSSPDTSKLPIDAGDSNQKPAAKERGQPAVEESPAVILQGLMDKFIYLKENGGKAESFKALQKSLAKYAAILSRYFIPLKDLMNLIMELETFIGKSGEHAGKAPEQRIRGFLAPGFIADNRLR